MNARGATSRREDGHDRPAARSRPVIDLEPGTQPAHYFAGPAPVTLLLANSGGYGLLAHAGDMHGRNKGGKVFLALEDHERLLPPVLVAPTHTRVACLSQDGRLLVFALDELKLQAKGGRGLSLMDVDQIEPLVSVRSCADALTVLGSGRGGKPKDELLRATALASYQGKRARKGRKVDGLLKVVKLV